MVRFKLDSGATCNVLPQESYIRIRKPGTQLSPGPRVRNYGARGGYLNVLGVFEGVVIRRKVAFAVKFVVVDEPGQPPILGLPTCRRMQLIQRVHSVNPDAQENMPPIVFEFKDAFMGIGKLPVEHDIRLASGANYVDPVVCAAGRLPFSLEEKVFKKLDRMVEDEIIIPVVEPTEWVSRMLVVGKPNGDVRIVLDPSELNKAILRQHFAVPTVEQLFGKNRKSEIFLQLGGCIRVLPDSAVGLRFVAVGLHHGHPERPLSLSSFAIWIGLRPGSIPPGHVGVVWGSRRRDHLLR